MKPLILLIALACAACSAGAAPDAPARRAEGTRPAPAIRLAGRVTDAAHLLDAATEARLTRELAQLERTTGHQLVIVTVPALHGQDIAIFTRNLANAWGIGRAKIDDGVVLLVAPNEHQVRIAVGYGLEAVLTPAVCKAIIDRDMLPRFRSGNLPAGIAAGTKALIKRLR